MMTLPKNVFHVSGTFNAGLRNRPRTVELAIAQARAIGGGYIEVFPGNYLETVVVPDNVTLVTKGNVTGLNVTTQGTGKYFQAYI